MPANSEESNKLIMESLISLHAAAADHGTILKQMGQCIETTTASLEALKTMAGNDRRDRDRQAPPLQPGTQVQTRSWQRSDSRERVSGLVSAEHQALLAHYDQFRSALGRSRSQFRVAVLRGGVDTDWDGRPDEPLLALSGQPANMATRIRVGGTDTDVAEDWFTVEEKLPTTSRTDPEKKPRVFLICARPDVVQVTDGTPVECYAGDRLVGVGVWPVRSGESQSAYASM